LRSCIVAKAVDQCLDLRRRDRIEGRGGLIKQDHLRVDRDSPRDAKPLLLSSGQAEPACTKLVLDLVPECRATQGLFDPIVEFALTDLFIRFDAESDVVVDRHRKRRRLLKHHADSRAQKIELLIR
jgi:hypothetical protein